MAKQIENPILANEAVVDTQKILSAETPEEYKQQRETVASMRDEFLKSQGIELLSREEISKMSLGEVTSYQVDMKNKLFEVQNSLPPKDFEASRVIFDEALNKVDIVKNPHDLQRLKEEFDSAK